jgi:ferritin-like metal-binding protein YciE
MPKMAKAAKTSELKSAFTEHLKQTKSQLKRLDQIAKRLGKPLTGHMRSAMKRLSQEGGKWMEEDAKPEVKDTGLIAAAQRIEHYEMAGYGTVRTYAKLLSEADVSKLLRKKKPPTRCFPHWQGRSTLKRKVKTPRASLILGFD